jgi:hypothetical protein
MIPPCSRVTILDGMGCTLCWMVEATSLLASLLFFVRREL